MQRGNCVGNPLPLPCFPRLLCSLLWSVTPAVGIQSSESCEANIDMRMEGGRGGREAVRGREEEREGEISVQREGYDDVVL